MKLTLQNKLMLPILATLLAFMGGSAFFLYHFLVKQFEEQTVDMLFAGNQLIAKNIKGTVTNYKISVRAISRMPQVRRAADYFSDEVSGESVRNNIIASLQSFLETLPPSYPEFIQFGFAAPDGEVIASSNRVIIDNINIQDQEYFKEAMQGIVTISPPLISKLSGEKTVMVAAPVTTALNNICGVIYAALPCRWIVSDTIENVSMGKTGYSYIVDGDSGLMIAHNVFEKVQSMDMFYYQPWMRTLEIGERGTRTDYHDSRGNRRLAVYYKEPVSNWIAVSCIATEEIGAHAAVMRNLVLACTLGSSLLVAVILIFVTRSVTNDVLKTNRFAQAVTAGDLDITLDMRRDDELGALGDAMRRMVGSIKRMMRVAAEQAQERQLNLSIMRDAMVLTLADLVESRDLNTGEHIKKTAAYVKIIIEELQSEGKFTEILTDDYIVSVVKAAPLHDIGKIHVPDAILNKPGKLTDEEFATMKTHAAVGGKIIEHIISITPDSEYLVEAKDLATYHHERWGGGGYPEGLSGEAIPLSARIMAVADVFDALVSDRAYKKGFPLEKAFAIIREESGTHFDPRIVDAFFAARDRIIRTKEELDEEERSLR